MEIRTLYSPKVIKPKTEYEPTRTQQHFKKVVNINNIMKKARQTGTMPIQLGREAQYGDFSGVTNFTDAMIKVQEANEMFLKMDADVRKRFSNNPAELLDFIADAKNLEEAQELGIVEKPAPVLPKVGDPVPVQEAPKVEAETPPAQ